MASRARGPFRRALDALQVRNEEGRRWIFVPYDQLTDRAGPVARTPPRELGVVLVESSGKASRRPYHRQKLALVLANLRHFALEQARRGVAVRHVATREGYAAALESLTSELGPLDCMRPAERELRAELRGLVEAGRLRIVPHEGWLTTREQFLAGAGRDPPWRMDAFYRRVRKDAGILMEDGRPAGGKWSHDAANREPWLGTPEAPTPPRFRPNDVTREVVELVEERFAHHPGRADPAALPATANQARRLWRWARDNCLEHFGPFEDAMSSRSRGLFHTRIAPLLNLHRLLPADVVRDAAGLDVPLASKEGFVRQVLGWREFVRHVHEETDGFRRLPGGPPATLARPGDGGWGRWAGRAWERGRRGGDGGATPSHLGAGASLPPAWWGEPSGLHCLDEVVRGVWEEGWTHHIPRLMVLSNLATLLDLSPREMTDWFWVAYIDAYDWVVEPNVLGMGTYAVGDLMTTKPYVSGAAYIDRMSDFCGECAFDPKRTCPITPLYWAFLARHEDVLAGNRRLAMPYGTLRRRAAEKRRADARCFEIVRRRLDAGEPLAACDLAPSAAAPRPGKGRRKR